LSDGVTFISEVNSTLPQTHASPLVLRACLAVLFALFLELGLEASQTHGPVPTLTQAAAPNRSRQEAGWWTGDYTVAVVGATVSLSLAAITWVIALRRRVREQTELIRQRLEREAALEEEHREFFENANDLLYTHDLEGNHVSVNKAAERILGYTREDFLRLNGFDLIAPEFREFSRQMLKRKLAEGGSTTYELDFVTKGGAQICVEVSTRLIYRNGKVTGVHGIARDLTQRKQAERLGAAFSNLGHRLSASRTPREAAAIIMEVADKLVRWDACYLHIFTRGGESLTPVLNIDTIDGHRVPVDQAYVNMELSPMDRRVMREGKLLILRDAAIENSRELIAFGDKNRRSASLMFVPIRNRDAVIGTLSTQSYSPRAYDESSLDTLQALADHCSGALERIQAEEALHESELRYRTLTENSPIGIWQTTKDGQTIFMNAGMCSILEIDSAQEMAGKTFRDFYTPASIQRVEREHLKRLQGLASTYEVEINGKRGGRREVVICGAPLRGADGTLHSFIATLMDITSKKRAEEALRDSEEHYRRVVENSIQGILIHQNAVVQFANRSIARILGFVSPDEMIGRSVWDFAAPEYVPVLQARSSACLRGEPIPVYHGWRGIRKDGSRIWIQSGAGAITWKGQPAILASCIDVSEQWEAEAALRQSEEQFSKAFHSSPIPICITTVAEGKFLNVNDSFLRLFGFSREEMIGRTTTELGIWRSPEDRGRLLEDLETNGFARDVEVALQAKSGELRTALGSAEFVNLKDESCLLVLLYDITERLNLEAQLRHAQKLEAVGQLAAGVAHDFNNIMTIIQGHASLLLLSGEEQSAATAESLKEISVAADRAANLTRQLLAFSRKQIMQPKPLQLNAVIGNVVKMLHRLIGETIALQCHYAPGLPLVFADATMIEQIIMNLAVNARDAMPISGQLTISTSKRDADAAALRQHPDARAGRYVGLTVADTGCGMDAATLSRMFEPFFTTKEVGKGTGLGLATVYGIVKQHRGWIEAVSEVGKGTTLSIYIPAMAESVELPPPISLEPDSPQGHETLLLVEDEPALRELMAKLLRLRGYRVFAYPSGAEAFEAWASHRETIDLLLTDVIMPGGVSGQELSRRLQADKPDLKVIFTSGYSLESNPGERQLPEGSIFLQKPYAPSKLVEAVRYSLDGGKPGRIRPLSAEIV
jgi:two-component system, cell cycle sensor histidine kinase and response regulator CckA